MSEYNSNFTGPEIDAALSRAAAGGGIDATLALKAPLESPALTGTPTINGVPAANVGQLCNPNLLDDCYFVNPVDQRQGRIVKPNTTYYSDNTLATSAGTTSAYVTAYRYTTGTASGVSYASFKLEDTDTAPTYYAAPENVVRGYTGAGYGIDRWRSGSDNLTVLIEQDGIVLSPGFYLQYMDKNLAGEQLTFSVLDSRGILHSGTGIMPEKNAANEDVFYGDDLTLFLENLSYNAVGIYIKSTIKPIAAQLELGSQQTLAHQDADGNWVLNEIPDYGEQLARCQRYCLVIGSDNVYCPVGTGQARTTSNYQLHIPLPVSLRTFPTITKIGKMWVRNQEGVIFLTSLNFHHNLSQNCISLECSGESDFTPGTFYESFTIPGGKLIISADL